MKKEQKLLDIIYLVINHILYKKLSPSAVLRPYLVHLTTAIFQVHFHCRMDCILRPRSRRTNRQIMNKGVTSGGKRGTIPRAPNHCEDAESLRKAPKSPNIVTSTLFNTVHLLPKDLRYEHGGAKLAPCHRRHLTSLCP